MTGEPFAEVLDFVLHHDECEAITLEVNDTDSYAVRCACGSVIERPIPGPDARYVIIFRTIGLLAEN